MAFDFMTFAMKAATDANERASFLADPKAYLIASGLDIPGFVEVTAVEVDEPVARMTIFLPPMLEAGELPLEALQQVSGAGCGETP
ncbi:MAG: hypothetical protein WCP26_03015 [Actinomycetes bacterium]